MAHAEGAAHDHHDGHQGGHGAHGGGHAGHSEAMFKRPFWVALALTIPVLIYAEHIQMLLGYTAPAFPGSRWLEPVLASVIYWYGGWVFLTGAVAELRARQPGMMTLVALAITTAYFYSLAVTFGLVAGMPFYWELATLVTIMLLGHWLEMRAVGSAQSALRELAKLLPDMAERITNGGTERVAVSDLRAGDLVLVRPGARVPADGAVEEGRSQLDESMITGESRPVDKAPGAEVIAGTVNGSGSLRARVTRTGDQTALAGIMRLVEEAQTSRTRAQALADRAAYWLTLVAIGAAALSLVGWTLARGFDNYTLERVVTTLVVACPHALGLAIPLVIAISTTLSARNGILVRDRLALEQARDLDVVVFDKTGTLTRGEQGLVDLATADGVAGGEALSLAAAAEGDSEHPLARAIVAAARERGVEPPPATGFQALPGRGVQATVDGRTLRVGGPRLLEQGRIAPPALAERTRAWGERGQTVVYLVERDRPLAAFALADVIRPESREAVETLKRQGIRVAMLTGDSRDVACWVAGELGIDEYFAEVLPEHKNEKIKELQRGGARVAMVGDGVNDAPALVQSDCGIALGAGTDVAMESAGVVLVSDRLDKVVSAILLGRASHRKMRQNIAVAVAFNALGIGLAVAGLVTTWVAIGIITASVVAVLLSTLSLLRLDLAAGAEDAERTRAQTTVVQTVIPARRMHCDACARRIRLKLGKVEGVRTVDADAVRKEVLVAYEPERVSEERLRDELEAM
ncbi:MAG: metal-transporting ATPase, partial [Chloroflexota bacterium]|nr:metal-transporting ATPase [Chloroflexota bacterium]